MARRSRERLRSFIQAVLAESPVSLLRLNEGSGTTAIDVMGVNNGTYTGTYTLGDAGGFRTQRGVALATAGYVAIGSTGIPVGGNARAIELWFKYTGNGGTLISFGTAIQTFILQMMNAAGTWYLFTDSQSLGQNNITISAGEVPPAGIWHHLLFRLMTNTTWEAWLNGALWKSGTFSVPINTGAISAARIGIRSDSGADGFSGTIADVAIYNYAISGERIRQHYQAAVWG